MPERMLSMRTIFYACLLLFYTLSPAAGSQLVMSSHRAEMTAVIGPCFFATGQIMQMMPHKHEISLPSLLLNADVDAQSTSNETGSQFLNDNKASGGLKSDLNSLRSQRNIFVTAFIGLLLMLIVTAQRRNQLSVQSKVRRSLLFFF